MEKVFRQLSDRSTSSNWCAFIDSKDIITALKAHPQLREAARAALTRLATIPPLNVKDGDELPCVVTWSHLHEAIEAAGDQLQELSIGFGPLTEIVSMDYFQPLLADVLPGLPLHNIHLRRLDLSTLKDVSDGFRVSRAVLAVTRGHVGYLKLQGIHAHLLALSCTGVRKLTLQYPAELIHDNCDPLAYSKELWRALGPDLEDIELRDVKISRDIMRKIRTFCRKLRAVTFSQPAYEVAAYVDLLVSYGRQLEEAVIPHDFSSTLKQKIMTGCPNFRFNCA